MVYATMKTTSQLTAIVADPSHPEILRIVGEQLDQQHLIDAYNDAKATRPKYGVKLTGKKGDIKCALLWCLDLSKPLSDSSYLELCFTKLYGIKGLKSVTVMISEDAFITHNSPQTSQSVTTQDVVDWFEKNRDSFSNGIETDLFTKITPLAEDVSEESQEESQEDVPADVQEENAQETKEVREPFEKVVETVRERVKEKKERAVKEIEAVLSPTTPSTSSGCCCAAVEKLAVEIRELKSVIGGSPPISLPLSPPISLPQSSDREDSEYLWFYDALLKTGLLRDSCSLGEKPYAAFFQKMIATGLFDESAIKDTFKAQENVKKAKECVVSERKERANAKSDDEKITILHEEEIPAGEDGGDAGEDDVSDDEVRSDDESPPVPAAASPPQSPTPSSQQSPQFPDWNNTTLIDYLAEYPVEGYAEFFEEAIDGGILDEPCDFLVEEAAKHTIYPPLKDVFYAFRMCPLENARVVILGQDPYPSPGAAMGIAFGHTQSRKHIQPSLKKIYKCLEFDEDSSGNHYSADWTSGDLTLWASEGVLLLNTALTVRDGVAGSHAGQKTKPGPWTHFIEAFLRYLSKNKDHLVVFLWGEHAKGYKKYFDTKKHFIIEAPHPAASAHNPSREKEFVEHRPFSRANTQLVKWGYDPIEWDLA